MPRRLHHQLWSQAVCIGQVHVQELEGYVLLRIKQVGDQPS